jgi:putative hemolysin
MKGKLSVLGLALALSALIVSGCGTATPEPAVGLANPASVYCEEQGYTLEIRTQADGGQYGVCVFPDGSECEEWAFYRGECHPASEASEATPTTESPTEVPTVAPTDVPVEVSDVVFKGIGFSYDGTLAGDVAAEVVPAVEPEGVPEWAIAPEHVQFTFDGYVLPETFHEPRIYVYPVGDFEAISEFGGKTIADLRQLLAEKPAAPEALPLLPIFNAGQMMRAQVAYLSFQNGTGVRFLTQYAQAYVPVNNHELFYTFQGLTSDGNYYVAAILPVSHPTLPADQMAYEGGDLDALAASFDTYITDVEGQLNAHEAPTFTPDLSLLDAMIASLEVAPASVSPSGWPVVAWGGFVKGLPADAQFDDFVALEPEGAGDVGLTGADSTVEAHIHMLRDSGTYAHFWGMLSCPLLDYGGCQLVVTHLREDKPAPFLDPDPVEGWEGTVVGTPAGAQFDDKFLLAGQHPVGFGIGSTDPELAARLESLRDTGTAVRVWGQVEAGVPDAFGTHIEVNRLEIVG